MGETDGQRPRGLWGEPNARTKDGGAPAAAGSWHLSFCAVPPKPRALHPGAQAPFPLFPLKVQLEKVHFKSQALLFLMGEVLPAHCLKHKDSERKRKAAHSPCQTCAWRRHGERALGAGRGSPRLPARPGARGRGQRTPDLLQHLPSALRLYLPRGIKKPLPHTTQSQSPRGAQ